MNRQIRGLAAVLMVCFTVLFIQVNLIQVGDRSCAGVIGIVKPKWCRNDLSTDPLNTRAILRDFSRTRGAIATADGTVIAKSVDSNDQFKYQRVYPTGALFGQITGYFSFAYGATALEKQYNDELSGQTTRQQLRSFSDLFVNRDHSGNLTLTMHDDLQKAARDAVGNRKGSAVVLDPRNGNVLALWSNPSYDPNPISHHDTATNQTASSTILALQKADGNPLLNKTYREHYPPGSTFKLVTGSVGVNTGKVTRISPSYPSATSYKAPVSYGFPIKNFSGERCGGTLFVILAESCNSAFAQMGTETIGPDHMISGSERFGFDHTIPIDLPGPQASSTIRPPASDEDPGRTFKRDLPGLAHASIGQGSTVASPLQMALVTAGIANGGVIMKPHLLDTIHDSDGNLVTKYRPGPWRRATSASAAGLMRQAMVQVVTDGTARSMAIPGFEVGAKTGTAEIHNDQDNDAWMVAWGGLPGQAPSVVVVVIIPNVPGKGNASTGSVVAGPAARALLVEALKR